MLWVGASNTSRNPTQVLAPRVSSTFLTHSASAHPLTSTDFSRQRSSVRTFLCQGCWYLVAVESWSTGTYTTDRRQLYYVG